MVNWTTELNTLMPPPAMGQRPFVCDGFPHESNVLIVGENPGQQMESWWDYWSPEKGFDRAAFSQTYLATKRREKADPFWNYRGTRARFELLHSKHGIKAVETNKYRNEKIDGAGPQRILNFEVLELLVEGMTDLRLVVTHGKVAADFTAAFGMPHGLPVLNLPHFRSLAFACLDEIVEKAK